ncbi:MAG: hypothetical protein KBT88_13215 [Gammaproteobacteria bacterium]|nr:hypothetical protein [Gammaproteobacteria bacterium]MBQ0840737.1 hypothetical protein [Gammaproteobacteria bacterium]
MRIKINLTYFIKSSLSATIKLVLILACALPIKNLWAQEDKPDVETAAKTSAIEETTTTGENAAEQQAPRQAPSKKSKSSSRFKPSEEISEDFSVPFPVDI